MLENIYRVCFVVLALHEAKYTALDRKKTEVWYQKLIAPHLFRESANEVVECNLILNSCMDLVCLSLTPCVTLGTKS